METTFYKSDALTAGKYRAFLLPSLLAALASQLGIVIDSLMVGNFINPDAMTGVNVCIPLEQTISAVVMLLSIGAAGMIAVAAGARQREEADCVFSTVLILNALAAALILALLLPFLRETAAFLAGSEAIAPLAFQYLQVMIWRTPFMMLFLAMSILVNADGMVKLAGQGTLLAQVVNIGLDILLIRVFGMGLRGAAIATVTSDAASLAYVSLAYTKSGERTLHFSGFAKDFPRRTAALVRSGAPAAAAFGLVSVRVWCVYQILEESGGVDAMQIYSVSINILTLLSMVVDGAQQAMMPVLGVLYGEKDYQGVRMLMTDSGSRFVLTTEELNEQRHELLTGKPYVALPVSRLLEEGEDGNPGVDIPSNALAYCIYTSGSTGRPKGVMIEHGNLCNFVNANVKNSECFHYVSRGKTALSLAALSFDVYVMEIHLTLANGMTLCMADETEIQNPLKLEKLISENHVDTITATPSYLEFTEKVLERHYQEQTSVRMMQNLKKKYQEA